MGRNYPTLANWRPSLPYVAKHWIDGPGEEGDEVQLLPNDPFKGKSWKYSLKALNLEILAVQAHADLRWHRIDLRLRQSLMVAPVLAGLLLLWIGYLRLQRACCK